MLFAGAALFLRAVVKCDFNGKAKHLGAESIC